MKPMIPAASLVGRRLVNVAERRREYDETLAHFSTQLQNIIEDARVVKAEVVKDYGPDGADTSARLAGLIDAAENAVWMARLARKSLP